MHTIKPGESLDCTTPKFGRPQVTPFIEFEVYVSDSHRIRVWVYLPT